MSSNKYDLSVILRVINQASEPLKKVGVDFTNLNQQVKKFGQTVKQVGQTMTMYLTLPVVGFGALALRSATKFQSSMNMVGAVTKATGKQFQMLTALARKLGATTQFSASEAAEGMKFLGMAGMKTEEILGALPKTLELAASAQLGLGDSANIVTNIMAGYGAKVEELGHVNDVLVNAFTGANVDLLQLGESFKMVGPIARSAGLSMETTASIIGQLGSAGIQGTMAGTGLKRMLLELQSPSTKAAKMMKKLGLNVTEIKDGRPVLKDMIDIIEQFEKAGVTGAEAAEMLGNFGGPIMTALLAQGTEGLRKFRDTLSESGTAAAVAEAQMKGLPGAFKLLASAWESLQLSIIDSGFGKMIENIVRNLAAFFQALSEINPALLGIITALAGIAAAIGPVLIGIGLLATGMATLTAVSWPIVGLVAAIVAAIVGGVVLVVLALRYLSKHLEDIKAFFVDLYHFIDGTFLGSFIRLAGWVTGIVPMFRMLIAVGKAMPAVWGVVVGVFQAIASSVVELIQNIAALGALLQSKLPKFAQKALGFDEDFARKSGTIQRGQAFVSGITQRAGSPRSGTQALMEGGLNKSETEVTVKVVSDQNSTATVEGVKNKKGDSKVNVATVGYVGAY